MPALASAIRGIGEKYGGSAFLSEDAGGVVTSYELAELDEQDAMAFDLVDRIVGLISVVDLETISAQLHPDSSAAVLVLEHMWAADFEQAVVGASGRLVAHERISGPHRCS